MSLGKKTPNLFQVCCEFWPMLRHHGHRGITVFHFVSDRAVFSSLDRMLRQRRKAYYTEGLGPELDDESCMLELTDLYVSTGCAAHDVQNSLKWSLGPLAGADGVKDLHIVTLSLRNSFKILHSHVHSFLMSHLQFDHVAHNFDEVAEFWQTTGIEADMIELVVDVNPWWRNGALWVSGQLEGKPDVLEKVAAVVVYMFKWRKFSDTRWCTIGTSCRDLLRSLCVGLEQLAAITRADAHVTDYHLHGIVRLSDSIRKYTVVASVVSFVPDAVLVEVMLDDRLVRRPAELHEAMVDELKWLEAIGSFTWQRLAAVVGKGVSSESLRSECVNAAHIAASYINRKVFDVICEFPWKLAVGDVRRNLEQLEASDEVISDTFAAQVRALLRIGFNRDKLVDAVVLLKEVPWSTVPVEQAHGSIAVLHRFHPLYSCDQLSQRSMLHQCRHLFTTSDDERRVGKQRALVDRLQQRRSGHISAMHAFMGFLMQEVKSSLPDGAYMPASLRQSVMKQHSQLFGSLTSDDIGFFARSAEQRSRQKAEALQGDVQFQSDALRLQLMRHRQEVAEQGVTTRSDAIRLTIADLHRLGSLLESPAFGRAELLKLRAQVMEPPRVPAAEALHALDSCPTLAADLPARVVPDWLGPLCNNRGLLQGSALLTSLEEGARAYLLLYSLQSPYQATFLPSSPLQEAIASHAGPFASRGARDVAGLAPTLLRVHSWRLCEGEPGGLPSRGAVACSAEPSLRGWEHSCGRWRA